MVIESIKNSIPPICKDGYKFVAIAFAFTLLLAVLDFNSMMWISLMISIWVAYFFRDPIRIVPQGEGLVVSPADGRVSMICEAVPPAEMDLGAEPLTRISIFLNVFNVHVNRVPIGGTISKLHYIKGKFLNAELDKASEDNERNLMKVTTPTGQEIGFIQIAGLVARRIVWNISEGQEVESGERFGLIRFGSRMDVFLPKGVEPLVVVGQTAIGAETILADLEAKTQTRRLGNEQ